MFIFLKRMAHRRKEIAQAQSQLEGRKALIAVSKVADYAHHTGRHIKPKGGIDFAGVQSDGTAPLDVRNAASQFLKFEEKRVKADPILAADLTLQKYADDTGRHILPNHHGLDLAGIKGDNTASPAVRKAASDILAQRAHFGVSMSGGVAHASRNPAAVGIPLKQAVMEAEAHVQILKANGASPKEIAQAQSQLEGLKAVTAASKVAEYAHHTGRHIKPKGGIDFAGVQGDNAAPLDVKNAASQFLKLEEKRVKEDPVFAANMILQKYADDTGRHILPNHRGLDMAGIKGDNTASYAARDAANYLLEHQPVGFSSGN